MISPIPLGLDGAAVRSASPRLPHESSSPDTILGHKSNCSESQLLGSPDIAVLNTLLLRATARRSTPPFGGVLPLTKLTHFRRGSRRGRPTRARAWPLSMGGPSESGRSALSWRCGSDRGRQPRSQPRAEAGPLQWGPDPTGGLPPHPVRLFGPGLCESAGRCAGRCAGRWSQP